MCTASLPLVITNKFSFNRVAIKALIARVVMETGLESLHAWTNESTLRVR